MDKKKVITAYRRGFISMQECKQILGVNQMQLLDMLAIDEPYFLASGQWDRNFDDVRVMNSQ